MNLTDTVKFFLLRTLALVDAAIRYFRPYKPSVCDVIAGDVETGSRRILCVFAHYDRDGMVDDYVVYYLSALAALGCEIVFVSTAPNLDRRGVSRILPNCARVLLRENTGHDFASWRDGLASCTDLSRYDRVILANDSVYGPIHDLGDAFDTMRARGAPVWSATDSMRYARHLQSYFLVFERAVVESEVFRGFWRDLPDYRFKHSVIVECEIGLSRRLTRAGFDLAALCEYESLAGNGVRESGPVVNATHRLWKALLEDHACPFLKVQLLRDNPKKIENVEEWEAIVGKISSYETGLIANHLRRMQSGISATS